MATTSNTYTANGSTVDFAFTFPYQNSTDIKVTVDEVLQSLTTHYTLHNATTIRFGSAPANTKKVKIYRDTDSSKLAATFYPGSAIRSSDLNDNYNQNLYVTQEAENDSAEALSNSRVLESGAYVSAITKATTAVTDASNALTKANQAISDSASAVSTANDADTAAASASSAATAATNTANSASGVATAANNTATAANNTANQADSKADDAVAKAEAADNIADNAKLATDRLVATTSNGGATWTLTGNNTNASTDPKGVGYAVTTAESASTNATNAVNTANAASAAVAAAVTYVQKANEAALQGFTPAEDASDNTGYYEVTDSTNLINEGWVYSGVHYKIQQIPAGFQGAPGLTVRLSFDFNSASGADASNQKAFTWMSYFANDPEERYVSDTRTFGPTVTYTVKVATKNSFHRYNGTGHSSGFTLDGQMAPFLELNPGMTYKFDQADSSNSGHPLVFYQEADKTTGYSTGVTTNGTPGNAGAYTQIVTSDTNPTILHYQCSSHAYMGNCMQMNTAFDRTAHQVIDAGNFDNATSTAALSNTYDGGNFDS